MNLSPGSRLGHYDIVAELGAGIPERLFQGLQNVPPHNYDVAPDGRRFLIVSTPTVRDRAALIVVVLHWMSGLRP